MTHAFFNFYSTRKTHNTGPFFFSFLRTLTNLVRNAKTSWSTMNLPKVPPIGMRLSLPPATPAAGTNVVFFCGNV